MFILLPIAFLFLFLSVSTGFYIIQLTEGKRNFQHSIFKALLTGTAFITVYLNILSLVLKTNFLLLIPLFVFSILIFLTTSIRADFSAILKTNTKILFSKKNVLITASFLLVLILFTFVPPYNADSSGYHFLSILWNEKFTAVPGLANLFPQYGYNSSFFVLSAAFSFTAVFDQSVYPINFILTSFFFLWMLKKSFGYNDVRKLLIWVLLIIFLRQFPINLASPSADPLASILVLYILTELTDKQSNGWKISEWSILLLLAFFAVIIKLSTLPLVLVILIPFVVYKRIFSAIIKFYFRLLPLVLLIIIPWLIRNVILSGYLVFPFPAVDIFSFDWKVPLDVVITEKLHVSNAPKMISSDWQYDDTLRFFTWFPIWIQNLWKSNRINCIMVMAALTSLVPVALLFLKRKTWIRPYLFPWLIAYSGTWFWMATSPDIRFGFHFMLPSIFFPLFGAGERIRLRFISLFKVAACLLCVYYVSLALTMLYPYSFSKWVHKPLKSPEYFKNNNLNTFKYVLLNKGIRLYIQDSAHHSINAPLPVCFPYREGIEMRGNHLEDGFKTQRK